MHSTVQDTAELERLRKGGEQAVADLFARYRDKLHRMIVLRLDGRVARKVDSEDVLQDAFMETARRIQDYIDRPSVPFFVWLRQITAQVLIDTHRRYLAAQMRDVRQEDQQRFLMMRQAEHRKRRALQRTIF